MSRAVLNPIGEVREYLDGWGSDLDDQRLILALVAAGVLEGDPWMVQGPDVWGSLRSSLEGAWTAAGWVRPDEMLVRITAEAAAAAVDGLPQYRLLINTTPGLQTSLYSWVQALNQHPYVEAKVACESLEQEPIWHWPLRFGFLPDHESAALREGFTNNRAWPELQTVVDASDGCDLLLLPMSISSVESLGRADIGDCGLALVLGAIDVPPEDVARTGDLVAFQLETWGCHLANQPGDVSAWLNWLTESLSHNFPIDIALSDADGAAGTAGTYTTVARDLLWSSRLESVIGRYAQQLSALGDHIVEVPDTIRALLPGDPPIGKVPAGAMGEFLAAALNQEAFGFTGETHEATGFALLVTGVGEIPDPGPMAGGMGAGGEEEGGAEVRIINGVVKKNRKAHGLALQAGEDYKLEVWIGVESAESITVAGAPEFPDEELPSGPNKIDVVFTCLDNQKETQRTHLTLPEKGDSNRTKLSLHFTDPGTVFGRLALIHAGRVIQTAVLQADVVDARPSRLGRPQIVVEEVIRSRITGVKEDETFDLAVVVNRDTKGRKTTSAIRKDGVTIRSAEGLQEGIDKLRDALTAVADDPDAFATMNSPQTLKWLHALAHFGHSLHGAFIEDHDIDAGYFSHGRIQIVSARADAYLPVEFFYDRDPPTVAKLCPNWKKAVLEGQCARCDALKAGDARPICLSGFWGVKYVVERHVHQAKYGDIPGDWRLQREPTSGRNQLKPLESIVWGLSDNIDESDRRSMGRALGKKLFAATKAASWSDVEKKVGTIDPSMVFLLPHTDDSELVEEWEIGGEMDMVTLIGQRMCAPREKGVVVILLGCDTAKTDIPYQGMVPEFRRAGASVVVTTINAILGRHAVPVAKELLKILKAGAAEPERSMGDAMRDLRRQALADGYPMVLSVVAFGDADWVLTA